ncbi:hypothetical protein A4S05_00885 [Nostoc sp. KVJ20]|uniref:hypothetical protein n=1 Tax=unclassified Nostoc TaxID=2593658 RepID=UPI00083E099C|nr:hypothetical protein [Nostoc sp. KVJ20]ODG98003.1 hypothetical protein A4S05_00885 [Nostoc sp. KVJ20]
MKEYKTKHGGYKIETAELSDGAVDVHVGKTGLLKTTWASPPTQTFDNHTQAVRHAKNAIDNGEIDSVFQS